VRATGVIGGRLYLYTRCIGSTPAFQRYDPATNSWKTLPLPGSFHSFPVAGVINGKFYLAGGYDVSQVSAVLEVYDPVSNTWGEGPPMLAARTGATGTVINSLLYVAGGWAGDSLVRTVEVYDPVSATWTVRPSIPTPRGSWRARRSLENST
jgi:N-acetylneuraminic acid mutarotase